MNKLFSKLIGATIALAAMIGTSFGVAKTNDNYKEVNAVETKTVSYEFTNNLWYTTTYNWTCGVDGEYYMDNQGVRVSTYSTGAYCVSPHRFTQVSQVVVTYNAPSTDVDGSVEIQVDNYQPFSHIFRSTKDIGEQQLVLTPIIQKYDGNVKMTVRVNTGDIYIKSIAITADEYPLQRISGRTTVYAEEKVQLTTNALNPTWSIVEGATTAPGATITSDGLVSVEGPGVVKVNASADYFQDDTHIITFEETPSEPYARFYQNNYEGYVGQTLTLQYSNGHLPSSAYYYIDDAYVKVTWYSYNATHLEIKCLKPGKTRIFIYDTDNFSHDFAICDLKILDSSLTISGLPETYKLAPGENHEFGQEITVEANGLLSNKVTWSSDNESVASVNKIGKVTANGLGTANITVTSKDNPEVSQTCVMTVCRADFVKVTKFVDGKKYVLAAMGGGRPDNINYFPAANYDGWMGNLYSRHVYSVTSFKESDAWTASVDSNKHIIFYNEYEGTRYYLNAESTDSVYGVTVDLESLGYWVYDYDKGLRFNNGTNQYLSCWNDLRIRQFSDPEANNARAVKIFYELRPLYQQEFEESKTQSSLAYRYEKDGEGNFTYSDIVMRFGGVVSKTLWNELAADPRGINGFGVILMDGSFGNITLIPIAMKKMVLSTVSEDLSVYDAIEYFVPIADMDTKIGSDENNYFWNLRVSVASDQMDQKYTAVAYIKLGDEYILMNYATYSVETLASDYLNSRGYDDTTAGGSLQNIVDNA